MGTETVDEPPEKADTVQETDDNESTSSGLTIAAQDRWPAWDAIQLVSLSTAIIPDYETPACDPLL